MKSIKVIEQLKELKIDYNLIEHPPAYTSEEADKYISHIKGVFTKTLFLTNKKNKNFYLIIMDDKKMLNMELLADLLNENRLKFCSEQRLSEKLDLEKGIVSLFGIINNKEKDILVIIDKEISNEKQMSFFANVNTKQIFIKTKDIYKFLEKLDYKFKILEI